ncbi:EF-hand domain-containing protein [Sphingomonas prati]|uniref:EF-hand domain-containing protein n=1 Tax=Sphingomonas prati TaxID=1843237 RepID=A0A7W9BRR2_9SPHN|nr:EF-hand domain-containing protein [Sphingomonas prati]MBB5728938.1 hypothetical protein [Sphingomonas prati]GGE86361.1 hypothetical protein GCM10011404_18930 [Sphingomonas prati]
MRPIALMLPVLITLAAAPALSAPAAKPVKGTGDVTRAQMQAEVDGVFKLADTNKDGFMSRAEFGKRMGVVLNRTPPGTKNAPTAKEAQDMLNAANAAFKAVDTNADGKLSPAEASRRPLRAFDMVDANHDGILTVAEKIAARKPGAGAIPDRKLAPGR